MMEARMSISENRLSSSAPRLLGTLPDGQVQTARTEDQSRVISALVLAFSADPANRWMYPAPEAFLRYFPDFARALGGRAFECGTAYFIGDVQAAALWLPPGVQPDEEALMILFQRSLPEQGRRDLFTIFEQMGSYHPHEPHWYLPLIGVDPVHQRKGYGSALLDHVLRGCDEEGVSAFLEASSLESIPLYQRHGFEVLGSIQVGTSPPVTPMLRRPH
ncbi:GNAT family N-acetyltransferase [Microvirga vignae]|uniref:GNAT family N-acetyltransferase n=1 Tax=Microvirga vignae TaxID=1225564 RepID=UPI000A832823|nr:GNAT family N-acetyltransferase [Microvirga vignae]